MHAPSFFFSKVFPFAALVKSTEGRKTPPSSEENQTQESPAPWGSMFRRDKDGASS